MSASEGNYDPSMIDSDTEAARRVVEAEREAREATRRLREASIALLEANQALAQIPLLERRRDEIWEARQWFADENARLTRENAELREENRRLAEGG